MTPKIGPGEMDFDYSKHPLYNILIFANCCESVYIPIQIRILEVLKKRSLTIDSLTLLANKLFNEIRKPKKTNITEDGMSSRFYLITSPLKDVGLIVTDREEGRALYRASKDGALAFLSNERYNIKEWFRQ